MGLFAPCKVEPESESLAFLGPSVTLLKLFLCNFVCVMRSACAPGLDPTDPSNMPRLWHKGRDFVKNGTNVPLLFRMATVADVKPPRGTKISRFLWKQPSSRKVRTGACIPLLPSIL